MEPDHRQIIRQQAETIRRQEQIIARQQARIAELEQRVAQLTARVEELSAQVAQLSKNSSTSSKPPSSDIVKPPKPPAPTGGRRHIGGQPGHRRHERLPFAPDQIDHLADYRLDRCPDCGARLRPMKRPPRTLQQVEIPEVPLTVTEHQAHAAWCPRCQRIHYAPLPPEVQAAGLVGPRLSALVAWLKGTGHGSFSTLAKFCRDVLGLSLSRGQLAKVIAKTSAAMQTAYEALAARLPEEPRLNVDETGHKENGRGLWTWCFRAEPYTLFRIAPSRGSQVLVDLLGREFAGVLGCDYFSAYRKYMGDFDVLVQFCLAHLIRDVKFLTTLPDRVTAAYGRRLLAALRRLFQVIHRRERMDAVRFQRTLERARDQVLAVGQRAPPRAEARNLAERFRWHGRDYFRFITTPGLEPTNNLAERAIRFVVQDRHVTQGTRSERGRRWCERIWTATATCAQQGRSVFDYLHQTLLAHFAHQPTPSLLPAGP
ncbi:MAG: IS66 family transposase [Phycisphaerae bacterium]